MKKTITRFQRLQLTLIVAALVAPLHSFIAAPAHAVAATCAEGGVCQVGDIGPGGGKVFYVEPGNGTFTQIGATGTMCTTNCKYLEAAPNTWTGASSDPQITWATGINPTLAGAFGTVIGTGYENSLKIVDQTGNVAASSAAVAARGYRPTVSGTTYSDWYLPSKDELDQLYLRRTAVGGSFRVDSYWSSTESNANDAWSQRFIEGRPGLEERFKGFADYVRPIRAFAPATKISITRSAVGTQRGTAFTTQPQITIQYTNNDTATVSSAVVTASISSGGTLVGTTTATASSGVATFSNLGVNGTIGTTYTISYTALDLPVASATVTLTGTSCDGSTFTCQVGDIGPGGGTIFYVAPTTFTQPGATGFMCTTACKYLEAAPTSGAGAWTDTNYAWSGNVNTLIGTSAQGSAIGTGFQNTLAIVEQNATAGKAGTVSRAYRGPNNKTDWYLPSKEELDQIYIQRAIIGGIPDARDYWSSTESNAVRARYLYTAYSNQQSVSSTALKSDSALFVRPIRAFGTAPTTISIANVVIPAPVLGATPVSTTTSNGQYTTAITWSGSPSTFVASTAYTATVTVTPVAGYTLSGLENGFFTVNGNAANALVSPSNFGTTGTGPYGVATDSSGNVYTANYGANNVTKTTPQGVSSILGTTGTSPVALIVDFAGNVYTANSGSNNVTKITAQGVSSTLGTTGTSPFSITIDASSNIYTANYVSGNVTKITALGASTTFGSTGLGPYGITIDSAGNIYTSNRIESTVSKIAPDGSSSILGSTGFDPYAIAVDSARNVYTANFISNSVTKITPQGVSTTLGATGIQPAAIALDSEGNVYTANYGADNVSKITPQGVSSILGATGNSPTGITIDRDGNFYIANLGEIFMTKFSATNSGVFTYQFPATAAPTAAPAVAVAPTPVPYLKTLTTPKLNLSAGKLLCTPGTYNAGYTLNGVVQGSATALYSPNSFTYNLLIDGIKQTSLAATSNTSSHSWNMLTESGGALLTCSVTVTANGLTNTDKSNDNAAAVSSALSTQAASISAANADYLASLSANSKAYQKALADNRAKWRSDTVKIRTDYYAERDRIKSLPSTKITRALSSAALKQYTSAIKKSVADYKASQPAALAVRDAANKAALAARDAAVAKASATYGTFIESIGYGVLIP